MKKTTVLVPDVHFDDLSIEKETAGPGIEFKVFHEIDNQLIPEEEWRNCEAVLIWHRMKITADVVEKLDKCKLIVRVGVGFDNVDVEACAEKGIPVSNVPNYGTTEVADHALALLLSLVRGVGGYQQRLRDNLVEGFVAEGAPVVRRIRGATFGAVGLGRIGTAVARRAAAFDMKVVFFDPYLSEGVDLALGFERVRNLEELLQRSDIVSLHTPLNAETKNIIDKRAFASMKQGAILLNIARGGLIDFDALYDALHSNHLAAAGVDVIPQEPPVDPDRLLQAWANQEAWIKERLIVTPHAAFYSEAGYQDMRTFSAQILKAWLEDGELRNNVNPQWCKQG